MLPFQSEFNVPYFLTLTLWSVALHSTNNTFHEALSMCMTIYMKIKKPCCSVSSAGTSHHPHKSKQLEKFVCATPKNIILNKLGLSTSLGSDFENFEVKCDAWGGSFY